MNECQRKTDGDTGKSHSARPWVAPPKMTIRNTQVITISQTSAAKSE
jgi:hypothetical protein